MVVVTVRNDNSINDGNVGNVDGAWRVSFRTHETEGTASRLEDGIEENSQATRKLDVITGMSQPGCS